MHIKEISINYPFRLDLSLYQAETCGDAMAVHYNQRDVLRTSRVLASCPISFISE